MGRKLSLLPRRETSSGSGQTHPKTSAQTGSAKRERGNPYGERSGTGYCYELNGRRQTIAPLSPGNGLQGEKATPHLIENSIKSLCQPSDRTIRGFLSLLILAITSRIVGNPEVIQTGSGRSVPGSLSVVSEARGRKKGARARCVFALSIQRLEG